MATVIVDGIEYERVKFRSRLFRQGNHFYRMRRGKMIQIPDEWLGQVAYKQTIRKRPSKKQFRSGKEADNQRKIVDPDGFDFNTAIVTDKLMDDLDKPEWARRRKKR